MTQTYTADLFSNIADLEHGFFTRKGGVSSDIYASLNCGIGSNDDKTLVMENRTRAAKHFGLTQESLVCLHQVHSTHVVVVDSKEHPRQEADAMVTKTPGIMLGILTADCAPILFIDPNARIIGAAHAGWKGALGNISEQTISTMESIGADRASILAVIGPCIAQTSYEVDAGFKTQFMNHNANYETFFKNTEKSTHFMFDLPGFALAQLQQTGIKHAICLHQDTYQNEEAFYSWRRTCHQGLGDYGRQLSAIALTA